MWAGALTTTPPGGRVYGSAARGSGKILNFSFGTLSSRAIWASTIKATVSSSVKSAARSRSGITRWRATSPVSGNAHFDGSHLLSVPLMANLQDDPDAMRNVPLRGIRLTACVSVPICIGIAVVAEDLVYVALPKKWIPIVPIVRILCGIAW